MLKIVWNVFWKTCFPYPWSQTTVSFGFCYTQVIYTLHKEIGETIFYILNSNYRAVMSSVKEFWLSLTLALCIYISKLSLRWLGLFVLLCTSFSKLSIGYNFMTPSFQHFIFNKPTLKQKIMKLVLDLKQSTLKWDLSKCINNVLCCTFSTKPLHVTARDKVDHYYEKPYYWWYLGILFAKEYSIK